MPPRKTAQKKGSTKAKDKYPGLGRPSRYKPEYAQQLIEHFDVPPGEYLDVPQRDGSIKSVWRANPLPTLAGFCRKLLICRKTLHNWAHEVDESGAPVRPEFLHALNAVKEMQEDVFTTNGLSGAYNGPFAALAAKNILDWRDKSSSEISGPDGAPIQQQTTLDLTPEAAAAISKSLEEQF
ncbi:hypothetical protein [Marinobacter qingdaonensis]|uniref:Terminase small subunit n=1 Tax=Marinobacter qingdaonensis TaxID=3108486 RepID=A0ABU5NUW4_9GAMM|nr:hypothetical protein [Marinobacter sp. ASW11-75]MEA1079507.1 hypothetical protein [Marinobacter sp. ASW11-75]